MLLMLANYWFVNHQNSRLEVQHFASLLLPLPKLYLLEHAPVAMRGEREPLQDLVNQMVWLPYH